MVKRLAMWPTWTRPPLPTVQIRSLYVNVRLFATPRSSAGGRLLSNKFVPVVGLLTLFSLLDRFIHHGPDFVHPGSEVEAIHIGELIINFFSECIPNEDFARDEVWCFMERIAGRDLLSGKVRRLMLCHGGEAREYDMRRPNINKRMMYQWMGYAKWGSDPDMKFGKRESTRYGRVRG